MSDVYIREVAKDIWCFSRPFDRFYILPLGGRSTAIKLRNGNVWVLASTPLTVETKETLDKLGPVTYLCSGDSNHWYFLAEYRRAYPEAKIYAPAEVMPKLPADITYEGVWGRDPPETTYEWEDEIKPIYFPGFAQKDVAFYHADSSTLLVCDLLFNLPGHEQNKTTRLRGWFPGISGFSPYAWLHSKVIGGLFIDKEAMKRDAKTVADLSFERIIPCHGDIIEKEGNKAWRHAYKAVLA